MLRQLAMRSISALVAIFGASIISFILLRVLPGNPARLIVGPLATEAALQAQIEKMGLNDSLPVQYWRFISSFVQGDWGFSYSAGQPVLDQMTARLPASLELGFYAFLCGFVAAVVLAILVTYRRNRFLDGLTRGFVFLSLGLPPFWLALISLMVFFEWWGILPGPVGRLSEHAPPPHITGFFTIDAILAGQLGTFWDALRHLILPAIALGLAPLGFLVRLLRANLLDVSREQFVTVVESKGVSRWRAHTRHVLPNAFLPTLTAGGLLLAQLLSGSVLVEKVFTWPGVGTMVVDAILRQDFAVVQAFILLSAVLYVMVSLLVDILYGIIDPRLRES